MNQIPMELIPALYFGEDDLRVARQRFNNLVVTLRENGVKITDGVRVLGFKIEVDGVTYYMRNNNERMGGVDGYIRPLTIGFGDNDFSMSRSREWLEYNPIGTSLPLDLFSVEFREFIDDYLDESSYE